MENAFSIRESIKTSWKLIKNDNLFLLMGLILGYLVIYGLFYAIQLFNPKGPASFIVSIINIFISVVFSMGYLKVCLQIAKGEEPEFKAFKDVIPLFFKYIIASFVSSLPAVGAMIVGGIMVFSLGDFAHTGYKLTPELFSDPAQSAIFFQMMAGPLSIFFLIVLVFLTYFKIRWMFFPYYIVDKNARAIESLRKSWYLTQGNIVQLLLLLLAFVGIAIVGLIALGIGIFVAIPIISMTTAVVYLKLVRPVVQSIESTVNL